MKKMIKKRSSIVSKGWLIIGVVLLVTGICQLFIANSLYDESNNLEKISNEYNGNIKDIQDHIETNARFLVIASFIIIITTN